MLAARVPTFLISLAAVMLAVFPAGCLKKAAPPPAPRPPEVFISLPVTQEVTDYEETTGRLGAVKTVEIRARVSGYLDAVQFTDGDEIQEGAPLFRIDQRPFSAALDRAEASAKQLETRFERIKRQEERMTRLADQKVTTAEELDQIKYQRMETEAELKAANAAVELARLDMTFTEIRAPFSGRIGRRMVDPGNLVEADTTVLATIVTLDPIYAYFDIDERTVLQLRRMIAAGKLVSAEDRAIPIQMALADQDDFTLQGSVNFVDNQLSVTTGTLRLRADVQNPNKLLAPGMYVRIRVPIGESHSATLIPEEALGSDQGQRFVYVLNKEDEVEYRRIKTGRLHQGLRVVDSGLTTEDRVIVKGLQRVRPGIKVNPKPLEQSIADMIKEAQPEPEILVRQRPEMPTRSDAQSAE